MIEHGIVNIGPFKADIREASDGMWEFRPYITHHPQHAEAIHMNAMIRDQGRIWTPIPEDEIWKVKRVLKL